MVICFTQVIPPMLTVIVDEKEKKIKESMKMVGLRDSVFWLSWFVVYFFVVSFVALTSTIVTKFVIIKSASFGMVFLVMEVFGMSLIMMAFMFTAIFSKAKVNKIAY
jgi:ATP-binding cassette subfamily A (ABC1) protein 5